jgi:murein DD-endopeptidase MepM/ murein hydrolase activator NlpD
MNYQRWGEKTKIICYKQRTCQLKPLPKCVYLLMKPFEIKKKVLLAANLCNAKSFPRLHLFVTGGLLFSLLAVTSFPSQDAEASKQIESRPIYLMETAALKSNERQFDFISMTGVQATPVEEPVPEPDIKEIEVSVRNGDNLSKIFQRAGLNDKAMYALVNGNKAAKSLAKIYPGHKLSFSVDRAGQLQALTHTIDHLRSEHFVATSDGFSHTSVSKEPEVRLAMLSNTISSSLYKAGIDAGLDDQLIMELAGIFGWDIDFALDIRRGDSFRILFEEKYLEGEIIGVGNILAAEFVNQSSSFKAVRYVDRYGKVQYYSPTGKAMQKAFLRAPLDFRRISSNFNPARLHPITKTVRPHRGTDYAASIGTPIWASGNGRVVASAFNHTNGNYVVIQHGADIQTKYLHLHKRMVKVGDRVDQKEIIGTVGTTGLSNGPHLHYEFLVSGVHRDPRTIVDKLPKAMSIDRSELPRFYAQTQPILAELDQPTRLASTSSSTTRL